MLAFSQSSLGISSETFLYGIFSVVIVVFLLIDLGFLNKSAHRITTQSALKQSIFWVLVSTAFGFLIYLFYDPSVDPTIGSSTDAMVEYFSAYLTEKALSVDNIFVILLILKYFNVKEEYYHNILFWGILGALVFRGVFIFIGAILVGQFHWILYGFGVLLIYSGVKIYFGDSDEKIDPEKNMVLRFCKKYLPFSQSDDSGRFVTRLNGKFMFTPLFLVIILIETTDLLFAIDSIPAAFAITQNEFLIYTSNIFAVLGLRAMFFLLAGIIDKFYLLQKGLSIILFFIGAKMLLELGEYFGWPDSITHIKPELSFSIIIVTLTLSIIFSVIIPAKKEKEEDQPESEKG
jgi:tellurite resistance protein TerC